MFLRKGGFFLRIVHDFLQLHRNEQWREGFLEFIQTNANAQPRLRDKQWKYNTIDKRGWNHMANFNPGYLIY